MPSGWSTAGWSTFNWAELGRSWFPVYQDHYPDYERGPLSRRRGLGLWSRARPYYVDTVFPFGAELVGLDKFSPCLPPRHMPKKWLVQWQYMQTLDVFAEASASEASWIQEPLPNLRYLYERKRHPRRGGSFYSPDDFEAVHPEPTTAALAGILRNPHPERYTARRQFPYGLASYFAPPTRGLVLCYTEPAITAVTSTWTEPAVTAITSTWTEPAVTAVTSTWTEPAITPTREEC